jgi:hypothetical protein
VRCLHAQLIADANVPQRAEQRVAMRGNRAVAFFPGPRRIRQVTSRPVQRIGIVALDDRRGEAEAPNLEQPDQVRSHRQFGCGFHGFGPGGFGSVERALHRHARVLLCVGGVHRRESVPAEAGEPKHQQQAFEQPRHQDRSLIT